jgi:hypothetical protein
MITLELPGAAVDVADVLKRIEAEYHEWPGLRLTQAQLQRLFRLEPSLCSLVVDSLVATGVLHRTAVGHYVGRGTE